MLLFLTTGHDNSTNISLHKQLMTIIADDRLTRFQLSYSSFLTG